MTPEIPISQSRKVNGYVKAVVNLELMCVKRRAAYDRFVRPLDNKCTGLVIEIRRRRQALSGGQLAETHRILTTVGVGEGRGS